MKRRLILNLCMVVALVLSLAGPMNVKVVHAAPAMYAKPTATGTGDCSSWENACTFQEALNRATNPADYYYIYLSEGTHVPVPPVVGDRRTATFHVPQAQDIRITGGYSADGSQYNWRKYRTILSGDLNGDDRGFMNNADNAYHVVTVTSTAYNTFLTGLTIRGGNANGSPDHDRGGGLLANPGTPRLTDILFTENYAVYGGGAYISGNYMTTSNPIIEKIQFVDNVAGRDGGGLYILSGVPMNALTFISNQAKQRGGGIFAQASGLGVSNGLFNSNTAGQSGGGMFIFGAYTTIHNATFVNNRAFPGESIPSTGGAIASYAFGESVSSVYVYNSILWNNQAQDGPQFFTDSFSSTSVEYSLIQGSGAPDAWNEPYAQNGQGNLDLDPGFVDPDGLDGRVGTTDDDLHLPASFPAFDQCNAIPNWVSFNYYDLDGKIRREYMAENTFDMGAYENFPIVYVDKDAVSGLNNGTDWANAYVNLADALSLAPSNAEIWVAEGTYFPIPSNPVDITNYRTLSFKLAAQSLYGGFGGDETRREQRNLSLHQTILDGNIGNPNTNEDNSYHVVTMDWDTALLDGFTIQGGNANDLGSPSYAQGGGILTYAPPVLRNILFVDNHAIYGGALALDTSEGSGGPDENLVNVVFRENTASEQGGAVWNNYLYDVIVLNRVAFYNNEALNGGAIYSEASMIIANSLFRGNIATQMGGAIDHGSNTQSFSIVNATFSENSAPDGSALALGDSSGTMSGGLIEIGNSIFWGNTLGQDNAVLVRTELAQPIFRYNLVQGSGGSGETWNAAMGVDGGGNLDVDPAFDVPGLRLSVLSPGIDRGNNELVYEDLKRDLAGYPRILDGSVDLGAYEIVKGNSTWPTALVAMPPPADAQVLASSIDTIELSQTINIPGQSRWYKLPIQPDSRLTIALTSLPANYDLTVYKDISGVFQNIVSEADDLVELDAEFAPDMYSPDMYSPDMYSPDMYSPDMYSPDMYSPDMYSPDMYSPDMYSPDMYSPDMYSPDMYSPDMYSPDMYSPDMYSPDMYSPDTYLPDMTAEEMLQAFSSAQSTSLVGISALNGTANENLAVNTWNNTGHYYVRVNGRNGAYDTVQPFHLSITRLTGQCAGLKLESALPSLTGTAGNYQTLVLTDWGRLEAQSSAEAVAALKLKVNGFAASVSGVVLDVDQDQRVKDFNTQADENPSCPYAKNLVAYAIKDVIDSYWAQNPNLKYIVLVGNDNIIPFYRQPDFALLGSESNYVPPVQNDTASQASLKSNFVLSQDGYGARREISYKTDVIYIPDLAVGRLVETPAEISNMLDAYTEGNGKLASPQTALVTGYDFLADAAEAVRAELVAGMGVGGVVTPLIAERGLAPAESWTADQLRSLLLGSRHDIIYLAGHFSAGSTLAADNTTKVLAKELAESSVDLRNALIYSAGCHSGYNLVNEHGFPISPDPDWAQSFARKGATAIAGTGYQYGDTDFIEYSERLYFEFTRQLRAGVGDRSVGQALVAAKQTYLMDTPELRGIHVKALVEATLFGLPMVTVNMPGERYSSPMQASIVPALQPFTTNPGETLGLSSADIALNPVLETKIKILNGLENDTYVTTYLQGKSGVKVSPFEPVLPLEINNISDPTGQKVMRGVGFRGGTYVDLVNIRPLTGAAATEIRGVHTPFYTTVFYPIRPWAVNYFAEFFAPGKEQTRLAIMPAQYISAPLTSPTGILRKFTQMKFRLFYSANTQSYGPNIIPALSSPPSINQVISAIDGNLLHFQVEVLGDPSAGVQEVWITYTSLKGLWNGQWLSLDLAQKEGDSRIWGGTLPLPATISPSDVRFMVQAVNGVGKVTLSTNMGAYYNPGAEVTGAEKPTTLDLTGPASGPYGTEITLEATLKDTSVAPVAGQVLTFKLGLQQRSAVTDTNGKASVRLLVLGVVGPNKAQVTLENTPDYAYSSDELPFEILKQDTQILVEDQKKLDGSVTIILQDATGRSLAYRAVFILEGVKNTFLITDFTGRATYTPTRPNYGFIAYFNGQVPLKGQALNLEDECYNASTARWGTLIQELYLPLMWHLTP